jgi:hypothetical protein
MKKLYIAFLFALSASLITSCKTLMQQPPNAAEATFVETYSSAEVVIKAKGIGFEADDATMDAQKAAIHFVILGGTDPLVQSAAERAAFEKVKGTFYDLRTLSNYIAYTSSNNVSLVKFSDGVNNMVKIEKMIRVNKSRLQQDLVTQGVLASSADVRESAGHPVMMVLPETPRGESPVQRLQTDATAKQAAQAIESYLTAQKYEVTVAEQTQTLNDLTSAQATLKNVQPDLAYQLALSVGADVYLTFTVQLEKGVNGGTRASAGCRAFETTTARLLGTETGYSKESSSAPTAALIREAMTNAVDKVLSRVNAYWKDDVNLGYQYKVIIKLVGTYKDAFALSDAVEETLTKFSARSKAGASGDKTFDYVVWHKEHDTSTKFYRALAKELDATPVFQRSKAKLKRLSVNRKLLILSIDNSAE